MILTIFQYDLELNLKFITDEQSKRRLKLNGITHILSIYELAKPTHKVSKPKLHCYDVLKYLHYPPKLSI